MCGAWNGFSFTCNKSTFSADAHIFKKNYQLLPTVQKMTNDVFYCEYAINQLWLVFIKDRMHASNDVFQLRFPKGSITNSEEWGDYVCWSPCSIVRCGCSAECRWWRVGRGAPSPWWLREGQTEQQSDEPWLLPKYLYCTVTADCPARGAVLTFYWMQQITEWSWRRLWAGRGVRSTMH